MAPIGWAAENYCMFLGDNESWKHIVEVKKKAVEDLGCKVCSTRSEGTNSLQSGPD